MTPSKTQTVTVTIREGCVVIIDGVTHTAGETVRVPASDAHALAEQGVTA